MFNRENTHGKKQLITQVPVQTEGELVTLISSAISSEHVGPDNNNASDPDRIASVWCHNQHSPRQKSRQNVDQSHLTVATVVTLLLPDNESRPNAQGVLQQQPQQQAPSIRFVLLANSEEDPQPKPQAQGKRRSNSVARTRSRTSSSSTLNKSRARASSTCRLRTAHDEAHAFTLNTSVAKALDALVRCIKTNGVGHRDSALTNLLNNSFTDTKGSHHCAMLAQVNGDGGEDGPFPSPSLGPVSLALRIRAAIHQASSSTATPLVWSNPARGVQVEPDLAPPSQHVGPLQSTNDNWSMRERYAHALDGNGSDGRGSDRDPQSSRAAPRVREQPKEGKPRTNALLVNNENDIDFNENHSSDVRKSDLRHNNQSDNNNDDDDEDDEDDDGDDLNLTLKPRINPLLVDSHEAHDEGDDNGDSYAYTYEKDNDKQRWSQTDERGRPTTPTLSLNLGNRLDALLDHSRQSLRDQITKSIDHDLERVFARRERRKDGNAGGVVVTAPKKGRVKVNEVKHDHVNVKAVEVETKTKSSPKRSPKRSTKYTAAMVVPALHAEVNELSSSLATTRCELDLALKRADELEAEVSDLRSARKREAEANAAQRSETERLDAEWRRAMQLKDDDVQALTEQVELAKDRLVEEQDRCAALERDIQTRSEVHQKRILLLQDDVATLQGSVVSQRRNRESEQQRLVELETELQGDTKHKQRIKRQAEFAERVLAQLRAEVSSEVQIKPLSIPDAADSSAWAEYEPLEDCVEVLQHMLIHRDKAAVEVLARQEESAKHALAKTRDQARVKLERCEKELSDIAREFGGCREALTGERRNSQRLMNGLEQAQQALAEANEQCRKNLASVGALRADKSETEAHLREALRRHEVTLGELAFVRNDLDDTVREAKRLRHLWKSAQQRAAQAEEAKDIRNNLLAAKKNGVTTSATAAASRNGSIHQARSIGDTLNDDTWVSSNRGHGGNTQSLQELPASSWSVAPSVESNGAVREAKGVIVAGADIFPTGSQSSTAAAVPTSGLDTSQINAIVEAATKRTLEGLQQQQQHQQRLERVPQQPGSTHRQDNAAAAVASPRRSTHLGLRLPGGAHRRGNVAVASPRRSTHVGLNLGLRSPRRHVDSSGDTHSVVSAASSVSRDKPRWV